MHMDDKTNKREQLDVKFSPVTKTQGDKNWVTENDKHAVNVVDSHVGGNFTIK